MLQNCIATLSEIHSCIQCQNSIEIMKVEYSRFVSGKRQGKVSPGIHKTKWKRITREY